MIEKIISFLKYLCPDVIVKFINKIFKRSIIIDGNYKNWLEAVQNSSGYHSRNIIEKSKKSFLKVINKEAEYERDSVLFYKKNINNLLINVLLKEKKNNKILEVLDFGGSFGSTYFQNYTVLSDPKKFYWSIIEQQSIVKFVNKYKLNSNLKFFYNKKKYISERKPTIILFSSVIQYLRFPFNIINFFLKKKINCFIFLKTPFHKKKELIKIQKNPKNIYDASYPTRIFNESNFLQLFKSNNYRVVKNIFPVEIISGITFKNFIFKFNSFNK